MKLKHSAQPTVEGRRIAGFAAAVAFATGATVLLSPISIQAQDTIKEKRGSAIIPDMAQEDTTVRAPLQKSTCAILMMGGSTVSHLPMPTAAKSGDVIVFVETRGSTREWKITGIATGAVQVTEYSSGNVGSMDTVQYGKEIRIGPIRIKVEKGEGDSVIVTTRPVLEEFMGGN